jgi:hypothetical protein
LPPLSELKDMSHNNEELAFDEPVEEGNFDFSQQKRDATESEAQLASADEDIQRAEAMVAQVEENIFRAKEEAEAQDNEEAEEEKRQAMIKEHEANAQSNNFASLADTFAENTHQSETSQNTEEDTLDDSAFNFDALANNFSGDNTTISPPTTNEQESSSALSNIARHLDTANQNAADSLTPEQALAPSEQVQRDALDKFLADGGVLDGTGDFDLADLLKNYTGETAGDEHSGE